MIFETVLPMWQAVHSRFYKAVQSLSEQDLQLPIGTSTLTSVIQHNAEVEFIFAEWFFGKQNPNVDQLKQDECTVDELLQQLTVSSEHLIAAMKALPEEAWQQTVTTQMGPSTPLEAVGRLMYHTGIHAGQISLTRQKH